MAALVERGRLDLVASAAAPQPASAARPTSRPRGRSREWVIADDLSPASTSARSCAARRLPARSSRSASAFHAGSASIAAKRARCSAAIWTAPAARERDDGARSGGCGFRPCGGRLRERQCRPRRRWRPPHRGVAHIGGRQLARRVHAQGRCYPGDGVAAGGSRRARRSSSFGSVAGGSAADSSCGPARATARRSSSSSRSRRAAWAPAFMCPSHVRCPICSDRPLPAALDATKSRRETPSVEFRSRGRVRPAGGAADSWVPHRSADSGVVRVMCCPTVLALRGSARVQYYLLGDVVALGGRAGWVIPGQPDLERVGVGTSRLGNLDHVPAARVDRQ